MQALKILESNPQTIRKRDYVNRFKDNQPKEVLFEDFIELTVSKKSRRCSDSFSSQYQTILNHIRGFQEEYDCTLYTNSINEEFMDDFILYLENKNLKINTIKGIIEKVKGMCRKAAIYGYKVDPSYDEVNVREEESFSIFLSMNDITRIYYYQGLTRFQEIIRDLFIVGCLTALRYSDYSTLTLDNFQGDYIVKTTKKTKQKVIIPMHDYVREIIKKYDGNIDFGFCIQYFNKYVKLIAKKIGFNDKVTFSYTKGGQLLTETKEKWELVSSHTARRSAATNMYLTGRLKTFEIMRLTGHTTEKNFFRYIKVTSNDTAKSISGDVFFRK